MKQKVRVLKQIRLPYGKESLKVGDVVELSQQEVESALEKLPNCLELI